MGDIHGAYKALIQCLERSGFDSKTDQLIQLGDIVDGYPEVFEVMETLLSIPNKILIKGNHDVWLDSFIETGLHPVNWKYGGQGTIRSYLHQASKPITLIPIPNGFKTSLLPSDIPVSHKQLLASQIPYYLDNRQRLFVHGGFDRHLPLAIQKPDIFYWDRDLLNTALQRAHYYPIGIVPDGFYAESGLKAVFVGHHPTIHLKMEMATQLPVQVLNITDLDTGAGHSGKLTIMELIQPPASGFTTLTPHSFWQSDPVSTLYGKTFR